MQPDLCSVLAVESIPIPPVLTDGGLQGGNPCISGAKTGSDSGHILNNIDPERIDLLNLRIDLRIQKTEVCARTWLRTPIQSSVDPDIPDRAFLQSLMLCKDVFCRRCNMKGGALHVRRRNRIVQRIKKISDIEKISLRKFTFPPPLHIRPWLQDKENLLAWKRGLVEIVRKHIPDRPMICDFHPFGEDGRTFEPHYNIAVVEGRGDRLKLEPWVLDAIRVDLKLLYIELGLDPGQGDMNFRYEFADSDKRVFHYLRYVSRPVPDAEQLLRLVDEMNDGSGSEGSAEAFSLLWFLLADLHGFQYVTYPGREWKPYMKKKVDLQKRFVLGRPEKIKMSMREFFDTYRQDERTELRPGVWLIIPRPGGDRKGEPVPYKRKKEVPDDG